MAADRTRPLRDNAFLVAALALPVVVAAFFLLATAIPRWTVADPQHDLVLRAARAYDTPPASVAVDFRVREGRVEAVVRPLPPQTYTQHWTLFLYDHSRMEVREIPIEVPETVPEGESRTLVVDALAGRYVAADAVAPDGYAFSTETGGASGLVGDLFGMSRYRQHVSLVRDGRMVPIELPAPYQPVYASQVLAVGWVVDER